MRNKQKLMFLSSLIFSVLIICGTVKAEKEGISAPTADQTEGTAEQEQNHIDDSWKQAYIDYINSCDPIEIDFFDIFNLDNDAIPELAIIGKYEASGCIILNYADGKVHDTYLQRLEFSYIEGENLLLNCGGNTGAYFDYVYSIRNGELIPIAMGDYDILYVKEFEDGTDETVYQYKWNGEMVSEEDYYKELNSIYDESKAQFYQDPGISMDAISDVIMNYNVMTENCIDFASRVLPVGLLKSMILR